jgi:hypothetical protein
MSNAVVTPYGNWEVAQDVKVDVAGGTTHDHVPINKIDATPAMVIVREKDHRHGIMLLNENPPQNHANPIDTQTNPNLVIIEVPKSEKLIPVVVTENAGWPCGTIVLWQ